MNIISRLFCYPLLERELANREARIAELTERVSELEDRLFIVRGLPPKGTDLSPTTHRITIPPYRTGRQRVRDMATPAVGKLSAEDERAIEESLTQ